MNLLEKIMNALDEDLEKVLDANVEEQIVSCEKCPPLGYGSGIYTHRGFIALETPIKYSPTEDKTYDMNNKEIYYEFATALKLKGLKNKGQLMGFIEQYMDSYFGEPIADETDRRTQVLEEVAAGREGDANHIGDFKKKGVATHLEKALMAQNILSLFEFETYFCFGTLDGVEHCFNIVRGKKGYMLLDYGAPALAVDDNVIISHIPFQGAIEYSEIKGILNDGEPKTFLNQYFFNGPTGYRKRYVDTERVYIVGKPKNEG